ncbi:hypothetical protein AGR1A_pAt20574 [Agrobacterium fabacearum CFBP 5771]|nr:hypothetical protein AGR1A_pAt20574 [Agrobacterium fabacearum CFBP 5771]
MSPTLVGKKGTVFCSGMPSDAAGPVAETLMQTVTSAAVADNGTSVKNGSNVSALFIPISSLDE